jgi:hypothetical protein
VTRLPDFIIIGAMKCATSTLHEQLAAQDGFFMSTPKEPCFFSDDPEWQRGIEWYENLFAEARNDDLCGESSTHYTKLPTHPHVIERMREVLPDSVKFIYVMRHPIDRLISHYIHEWTQRVIDGPIERAVLSHRPLVEYGLYAKQLRPYLEAFGTERVLPVFFERVVAHSQSELQRIAAFVGHEGEVRWLEDLHEQNVSQQRLRKSTVRDFLVNLPGLRAVRRTFVPVAVRERIKGAWTMKERPQLPDQQRAALEAELDEDLAQLGAWLGLELNCANFKDVGRETIPEWTAAAGEVKT